MAANCLGSRDQAMKDDLQCLQENLSHLVSFKPWHSRRE
ncbi:hypothetical protein FHT85_001196 [Rhizobium sp. BK312]|jgi:hypothetical protein|nr:hypothetical protein [Rhizobium sp. BK312]